MLELRKGLLGMLLLGLLFVSCADDDEPFIPVPVDPDPPTLTLDQAFTSTIDSNAWFSIKISAVQGDTVLRFIEFFDNDVPMGLSNPVRVEFNGTDIGANPMILFAPDSLGFSNVSVLIRAHNEAESTHTYKIEVTDVNGKTDDISFDITTNDRFVPTPLTQFQADTLWNFIGDGKGSLVLPGFMAVSSSEDYDLREATTAQPWTASFFPNAANNVILKQVDQSYTWDGITDYETVETAWSSGTELTNSGTLVADVAANQVFMIQKDGGDIFLARAQEVYESTTSNDDFVVLQVKRK